MKKDSIPAELLRPSPSPRPDRRHAILLAAEKLFAQRGYHGVSIRQIADEAGVPLALVGYYYGQKHQLFQAIFEHWSSTIRERMGALEIVRKRAMESDYLEQVIDAFVKPVLRLRASPEGEWYALLMTRGLNEPGTEVDQILREYFDPMANAFIDALQDAFPKKSRAQVAWAYQFMLGALLHHIGDQRVTRLSGGANEPSSPLAAPLLTAFITGGMRQAMAQSYKNPKRV
jgi:AcrR family transcriptional regulator